MRKIGKEGGRSEGERENSREREEGERKMKGGGIKWGRKEREGGEKGRYPSLPMCANEQVFEFSLSAMFHGKLTFFKCRSQFSDGLAVLCCSCVQGHVSGYCADFLLSN